MKSNNKQIWKYSTLGSALYILFSCTIGANTIVALPIVGILIGINFNSTSVLASTVFLVIAFVVITIMLFAILSMIDAIFKRKN